MTDLDRIHELETLVESHELLLIERSVKIQKAHDALKFIESRLQSALDGNGHCSWSEDYLREIVAECLDRAQGVFGDADEV